jgi:uncharacterized hydantoinase/oxoprolinase family protein
LDVYLLLGVVREDPPNCDTADGRPATRAAADLRLARMLGADRDTSRPEQRKQLAEKVARRQEELVGSALGPALGHLGALPRTVIVAGEGEFLARAVLARHGGLLLGPPPFGGGGRLVSLRMELGEEESQAACAWAVAVLAAEKIAQGRRAGDE